MLHHCLHDIVWLGLKQLKNYECRHKDDTLRGSAYTTDWQEMISQ